MPISPTVLKRLPLILFLSGITAACLAPEVKAQQIWGVKLTAAPSVFLPVGLFLLIAIESKFFAHWYEIASRKAITIALVVNAVSGFAAAVLIFLMVRIIETSHVMNDVIVFDWNPQVPCALLNNLRFFIPIALWHVPFFAIVFTWLETLTIKRFFKLETPLYLILKIFFLNWLTTAIALSTVYIKYELLRSAPGY